VKGNDLSLLPRVKDGWTFLYVEHARIEQDAQAILILDEDGRTPVPVAALSTLLLGPGTVVTHAAIGALAKSGCSIVWCGEDATKFYASGQGETRKSGNLMAQAAAWADPQRRLETVKRMYRMRFPEALPEGLTIEQLRGREGVRVRETYATWSRETGVPWTGRSYQKNDWASADPVNRALSAANACLYGVVHGAVVAMGFSPGLGFIHTGKLLAFVYDVADLYKCETSIPAAFRAASANEDGRVESMARRFVREAFRDARILERIVRDVPTVLGIRGGGEEPVEELDETTTGLWDPAVGVIGGGRNFSLAAERGEDP